MSVSIAVTLIRARGMMMIISTGKLYPIWNVRNAARKPIEILIDQWEQNTQRGIKYRKQGRNITEELEE